MAVDGSRYAVFGDNRAPLVHVIDAQSDRAFTVAKDPDCWPNLSDSGQRAMAAGRLILFCYGNGDPTLAPQRTVLLDVRTGRARELPPIGDQGFFTQVGRYWAAGRAAGYFLNLRTERVVRRRPDYTNGFARVYNLDEPTLPLVTCGKLTFGAEQAERFYSGHYVVGQRAGVAGGPLVLARSCSHRIRLDSHGGDPYLASGVVSWSRDDGSIHALRIRSGHRARWHVRVNRRFSIPLEVANTADRLFVSRTLAESGDQTAAPSSVAVYEARIAR